MFELLLKVVKVILVIPFYLISIALCTVLAPIISLLRSLFSLLPFTIVSALGILDYPVWCYQFLRDEFRLNTATNLTVTAFVFTPLMAVAVAAEFALYIPFTILASVAYAIYLVPRGLFLGITKGLGAVQEVSSEEVSKDIAKVFINWIKNAVFDLVASLREYAANWRGANQQPVRVVQNNEPEPQNDQPVLYYNNTIETQQSEAIRRIQIESQRNIERVLEQIDAMLAQLNPRRIDTNRIFASMQRPFWDQNSEDTAAEQTATLGSACAQYPQIRATEEALTAAKELVKKYSELPKEHPLRNKKDELENALSMYEELDKKLKHVQTQIVGEKIDEIEDELIGMDMNMPILVVKQYCEQEQWKTVPGVTHVADYKMLGQWLDDPARGTHPWTRDDFKRPPVYKKPNDDTEYETRYVWFKLTLEYCYAPALGELAQLIDELLLQSTTALQPARVSNCRQTLFAVEGATEQYTAEELAFLAQF